VSICLLLGLFADGELSDEEAERFRDHLAECQSCKEALIEHFELCGLLLDVLAGGDS
jgi:anti-sigma factor RsiW